MLTERLSLSAHGCLAGVQLQDDTNESVREVPPVYDVHDLTETLS